MCKTENCCGLGKPGSSCHISCYICNCSGAIYLRALASFIRKGFFHFYSCSLFSVNGLQEAKHMCIMCPLISMVPYSKTFSGKKFLANYSNLLSYFCKSHHIYISCLSHFQHQFLSYSLPFLFLLYYFN